jgi:predicted RNase H-like HicB family nuclease
MEVDLTKLYYARQLLHPGCISQGETEEEVLRNIKEAIELHLQCLSENGIPLARDSEKKETMISVNP